jgi:hypothetical protein
VTVHGRLRLIFEESAGDIERTDAAAELILQSEFVF